MDNWDEIRTALHVAREGTVSGAAARLGVHHATVIRHVDALEARLGVKLFQRHARGYTPTEAGADLMRVGQTTEEQFTHLESRLKGRGDDVSGELIVTTISSVAALAARVLVDLQLRHPGLTVRLETGERLFRMEYGEAHVALRAGRKPDHPDNVVQPLMSLDHTLYAADSYVHRHGLPNGLDDFAGHMFVGPVPAAVRAPFHRWMAETILPDQFALRASDDAALEEAVIQGAGIGFLRTTVGDRTPGLTRVCPPQANWAAPLWLVTHVDLHRTAKVQAALHHLKQALPPLLA